MIFIVAVTGGRFVRQKGLLNASLNVARVTAVCYAHRVILESSSFYSAPKRGCDATKCIGWYWDHTRCNELKQKKYLGVQFIEPFHLVARSGISVYTIMIKRDGTQSNVQRYICCAPRPTMR